MKTELLADLTGIVGQAVAEIEARLREELDASTPSDLPKPGSAESMIKMLEGFEHTTPTSGKTADEAAKIALEAGMDPRGAAGYYGAGLLKADMKADCRWITEAGLARLEKLREH